MIDKISVITGFSVGGLPLPATVRNIPQTKKAPAIEEAF